MSGTSYKKSTLIGESPDSIEGAVQTALQTSADKVHGQRWCEIKDIRANVNESGGVDRWQVEIEVAFEVDGS
jgi:flavin-binding protein dodecin